MISYFITGTDTDVGKTVVSRALMQAWQARGNKVIGVKPISAGCEHTAQGLRNQDALVLQQQSDIQLPYELHNPLAFEPAIAPHIAAAERKQQICDFSILDQQLRQVAEYQPDICLIEGAGGWRLPLGQGVTLADWVKTQHLPVILVVGIKLGCLNHALLTAQAIEADGLRLAGWVANRINPGMGQYRENVQTLCEYLPAPLLGEVPYLPRALSANLAPYIERLPT